MLVQLGTGEGDVNEKMTAALTGLLGWKNLQVVLTKKPVNNNGENLAPSSLDIKVVRYFPLARLLKAFDASICAAGYNGIHELLAAGVPTAFVPNIRGTDDQEMRAKWCADFGYALMADQSNLEDIEVTVRKLQSEELRSSFSAQCEKLPEVSGGAEVAKIFLEIATTQTPKKRSRTFHYLWLNLVLHFNRGSRHLFFILYRQTARIYQLFKPYTPPPLVANVPPIFSQSRDCATLRDFIKGQARFEHLIDQSSAKYREEREQIAKTAYGFSIVQESGNLG